VGRAPTPAQAAVNAVGVVRDALPAAAVAYLLAPVVAWIATLGRGCRPASDPTGE